MKLIDLKKYLESQGFSVTYSSYQGFEHSTISSPSGEWVIKSTTGSSDPVYELRSGSWDGPIFDDLDKLCGHIIAKQVLSA